MDAALLGLVGRVRQREAERQRVCRYRKPGSTCCTRMKLFTRRPAPASSATARAHLAGHERAEDSGTAASGQRTAPTFLQRTGHRASGRLERRRRADEQPGHQRDADRERDDGAVHPHFAEARDAERLETGQRVAAPGRDEKPRHRADHRQQQAFRQQLADEPPAAGAERRPHRELALARGRACEQQVGDVRARDEQHEADGAQQQQQRGPRVFDDVAVQRGDRELEVSVVLRVRLLEAFRDVLNVSRRGVTAHAVLHAADHVEEPRAAVVYAERLIVGEWHPELALGRVRQRRRHHADDRVGDAVQPDRLPDDVRVPAEALHPEAVTEQDDVVFARLVLLRAERTPEDAAARRGRRRNSR